MSGLFFDDGDRLLAVGRGQHFEPVRGKQIAIRRQKLRVVVDHQQLSQFEGSSSGSNRSTAASQTKTVLKRGREAAKCIPQLAEEREARRGS